MYQSVDQALRAAYKLWAVRIEPINNTAQIMDWCANKGVLRRGSELTQHEYHANAAMIQSRVERVLNRFELAVIEMQYTGGLKADGIIDLTAFIEKQNNGVNLLACDDVLMNLFANKPRRIDIMDKYDVSNGYFYRQHNKVKKIIGFLLNQAICKLEADFIDVGIIDKIVVV